MERICFQIEEAQWYYEDFIRPLDPDLPSMTLRTFCSRIFEHCPSLSGFPDGSGEEAFKNFMLYKRRIPVRGAILLNDEMDSVVLVKGWKKNANWSFPRGKINLMEDDLTCAIREVYEETGLDLETQGLVPEDRNVKYIDITLAEQQMRLFVFRDIPLDTYFEPKTRKEISRVAWWRLSDLPAFRGKKRNGQDPSQNAFRPNDFYMVAPFLAPLRRWVIEQKKLDSQKPQVQNNQYQVPAGQDDLTEDDLGAEPRGHFDMNGSDTDDQPLEATAAFNRLLNIEPPGEEYMAAAPTPPPAPPPHAPKNTGKALLDLLQGNSGAQNQFGTRKPPPPHTPLDHTIEQAAMPRSPHYHHPRPPPASSILPPPPPFPIQAQKDSFSYQQQEIQNAYDQNTIDHREAYRQEKAQRMQNPHPYQPQHLIHPQPLPPHVQRAVFTGGPAHAPMPPPPVQQQVPPQFPAPPQQQAPAQFQVPAQQQAPVQFKAPTSVAVSNSQFTGMQAPMVPQMQKQTPPKLTSHSLALLNAFKTRDQAQANTEVPPPPPKDPPLRRFEQTSMPVQRPRPQELLGDLSQSAGSNPYSQPRSRPISNGSGFVNPDLFAARPPISATQKSTLLGLFKSPTSSNAEPAQQASATALPISSTPSAVELSAVEPLSSNAVSTSALLNDPRQPTQEVKDAPIPEMNPELNLPYRAMTILARPSESNDIGRAGQPMTTESKMYPRTNRKKSTPTTSSQAQMAPSPKRTFQPQILRRPQSGSPQVAEGSTPTQSNYTTSVRPVPDQQASPSSNHMPALLERHTNPPPEHKQALLSLFGKNPGMNISQPLTKNPSGDRFASIHSNDPTPNNASAKSRVGSLVSGDAASRRGSGTQISPADKGFLFSYLENVVNGG
jgi:mRNA-decapping enzyme subunit 2